MRSEERERKEREILEREKVAINGEFTGMPFRVAGFTGVGFLRVGGYFKRVGSSRSVRIHLQKD